MIRLIIIVISAAWGIGAVAAFVVTADKSLDAKLTAAYFGLWPALALTLIINQPVPLWLAVPVTFGFIPWFLSGPHLWSIMKAPERSRADELVGIPLGYAVTSYLMSMFQTDMFSFELVFYTRTYLLAAGIIIAIIIFSEIPGIRGLGRLDLAKVTKEQVS